jgi:hypothetical protein
MSAATHVSKARDHSDLIEVRLSTHVSKATLLEVQHLYYIDTEDIENLPYYNKENRRLIY